MAWQAFLKFVAVLLILAATVLTAVVSQFEGHSLLDLFIGSKRTNESTLALSVLTIDHPYIAQVNLSAKEDEGLTNFFSPTELYVDIDFSGGTTNIVTLNHVKTCHPYIGDRVLPHTIEGPSRGDTVMVADRLGETDTWLLYLTPYQVGNRLPVYHVRCTLSMPRGALNRTLVRRRLYFDNLRQEDIIDRAVRTSGLSVSDAAHYKGVIDKFENKEYKNSWYRTVLLRERIETAENVDISGGFVDEEDAAHSRRSQVDNYDQLFIEWDDIRYAHLRDFLMPIIPAAFGLGFTLLFATRKRKPRHAV